MTDDLNKGRLPDDLRLEIIARSKKSLYFFAKAVLGYDRLVPQIHGPLCKILENRDFKRLRILLPRGWYKSTIVSIAYPIWEAINNADVKILIAQNTMTNAVAKLAAIDSHFVGNDLFRSLFPDLLPDKNCIWTTEKKCVKRNSNAAETTFEAAGIRTQVVSRHYDIIIEDDTVAPDLNELGEDNLAPTKDDIEQAIGWHRLVPPLLDSMLTSRNIVVGTRWFERDLLSWIADNQPSYKSYVRSCRENEHGESDESGIITFPEQFNEAVLEELKHALGPYMFSCLYLNKPIRSGDMAFRPEWFAKYDTEPAGLITTTTVDPGGDPETNKTGVADYTVVLTCGKQVTTGEVFVLAYDRFKGSPSELIDCVFKHVRLHKPVKVGIMAVAYEKSLFYWIKEQMRARNCWFMLEPLTTGNKSKGLRIMGLQPLIQSGMMKFKAWMVVLINELVVFPLGANDDVADALAMQLPLLRRTVGVRQDKRNNNEPDPLSLEAAVQELEGRAKADPNDPLSDILNRRGKYAIT